MTRICVTAEALPADEEEKNVIRIVLRPEKEEGEPDPDLSEEIRKQIREQTGTEDPELEDRLCACVTWSYVYEGEVTPPGEKRMPGESEIVLFFEEDPEYVFEGWTVSQTETDSNTGSAETDEAWGAEEEISPEYEETWESEEENLPEYEETWESEEENLLEYEETWESEEEISSEYEEVWDLKEDISGEYDEVWETEEEIPEEYEDIREPEEDISEEYEEIRDPELRSYLTTWPRKETITEPEEEFYDVNTTEEETYEDFPDESQGIIPESVRPESSSMGSGEVNSPENTAGIRYVRQAVSGSGGIPQTVSDSGGVQQTVSDSEGVPQSVTQNIEDLIQMRDESARTGESEMRTEVRLLRTDSSGREEDLTEMYREALAGTDPERINWETVLAPLPENDGTYVLRRTETDNSGKSTVRDTAFSVNRFGSVYTYSETAQALRGKTVRSVSAPLVVSEFNPDILEADSWNVNLSLDGRLVEPVQYTVCKSEDRKSANKWNRYDYVIDEENFRENGVYRLKISSRDTSGNFPETHRYNGGELVFTVDGSPPELQAVQGLEKAVVTGRKAEVRVTAFDTVGLARVSAFVDGKCMAAEDKFSDRHRAELSFSIARGAAQNVRIVAEDTAENVLDTDEKTSGNQYRFRPTFPFVRQITVRMPVSDVPQSRRSPALLLMIIGCAGASAGLLWYAYRQREQAYHRPDRDSDPD